MSENPLLDYYRQKEIYIKLPTGGKWYNKNPKLALDGEIGVRPMTLRDELVLTVPDALYCIEPMKHGNMNAWCPNYSNDKYGQTRNLKNALANSINTISARLIDQVGPKAVVTLMKKNYIKDKKI